MSNKEIKKWTLQEFIRHTSHELNQKSRLTPGFIELLLQEDAYGPLNEKQKEVLLWLKEDIESICWVVDSIKVWYAANRGKYPE